MLLVIMATHLAAVLLLRESPAGARETVDSGLQRFILAVNRLFDLIGIRHPVLLC